MGCYGKFYGSIDPVAIMCFLREFVGYRNDMICSYEDEARQKKREMEMGHCVSYDRYLKMKDEALT